VPRTAGYSFYPNGAASSEPLGPFAPPSRPGPTLSVPAAALAASLQCTANLASTPRTPVLLVHGTTVNPPVNFSWNYEPAFVHDGIPFCTVALPDYAMGDIQIAGEYVVNAIRTEAALAGRKIDVLGYSQGGMVPRWAFRFWPDTRALVQAFVAIDPSNFGTLDANALCLATCAPAIWQQQEHSHFLTALNSGGETFAGIAYTVVFSRLDEVVVPNLTVEGNSALHTGSGAIVNIPAQMICPLDVSEHLAMGTTDPVAYAVAIDAFTHPSAPANPARIAASTCAPPLMPGVDPATLAGNEATLALTVGSVLALTPHVATEPPLAPYVFAGP
jgi:triacylglycerol esterase/lipase EstA (alpha/beta hydrolase family)